MSDEQTPRRRGPELWRTLGGALLITLGVTLLIERATGINLSWVPLAIGIAFLAVWWRERWHGFLIAGGILTGIGLGSLLGSLVDPRWADGLDTIAFGGGFFLIYALDGWRRRSWWAGLVAAIFAIIGLFELANAFRQFVDPELARGGLPVIVIALGLVLLLRTSIPRGLYRFLVVVLVIVAIAAASASAGGIFGGFDIFGGFQRYEVTRELSVADVGDRTLVVEAGHRDVRIINGDDEVIATVTSRARTSERARRAAESASLFAERSEDEVLIRTETSDLAGTIITTDYEIRVSSLTKVRVITSSGDVSADAELESLEISTSSGDVDLNGRFTSLEVRTSSGDVELRLEATDPSITVRTSSGSISVDRWEGTASDRSFQRRGTGDSIEIITSSGDVEID